ncbi:MAG: hypothetical protein M0C28_35515 [Candidatus Moduliflexus flocculans]|nr:hypothetical protein [Candidatus Moduliflexus flocculans]
MTVGAGPLFGDKGATIAAADISVSHVEYVRVTTPTDALGKADWWPDPLPPYTGPFTATAGENHPLWITVRVPSDAAPGLYKGAISLSAEGWSCRVPVELAVRGFGLPERPSVRSSFGLPAGDIKAYHNLETREELERVVDLYHQDMRAHRVAPTSPFELYPMKVGASGVFWKGGEFVSQGVHSGRRAYKVADDTVERNVAAEYDIAIPIAAHSPLKLTFWARTARNPASASPSSASSSPRKGAGSRERTCSGSSRGRRIGRRARSSSPGLGDEAASLRLSLFPAFPGQRRNEQGDRRGSTTSSSWRPPKGPEARIDSLLAGGDFEMPLDSMKVAVDFSEFDRGARRILDELGFNAYNLPLEGPRDGVVLQPAGRDLLRLPPGHARIRRPSQPVPEAGRGAPGRERLARPRVRLLVRRARPQATTPSSARACSTSAGTRRA